MTESLSRPVLLVTGGSRGIGAAVARMAAARGYDVAVNFANDSKAANATVAACIASGANAIALKGDMAREQDIVTVFDRAQAALGPITHVFNNAGITGQTAMLADALVEDIRATIDLNVTGAILVAREAVRRMSTTRGGKGGVIVNTSSVAAVLGSARLFVWYAASKAAIDILTLGLAQEVASEGIRVNGVQPGIIDTDIHVASGLPDRIKTAGSSIPLGRVGTSGEIAETVMFLFSDAASYVTGATLRVSGGR